MEYQPVARFGILKGSRWPIEKELAVVGRSSACDVVLADSTKQRNQSGFLIRVAT